MFEKLIGNEQTKATLSKLFWSERFPQSVIFAGKSGIGKKLFALELAKAGVCSETRNAAPCQTCGPCIRSQKFNLPTSGKKEDYQYCFSSEHPDVGIVIPNKKVIYVDAIRDLEHQANYRPFEASARYFVIEEAEKMTAASSNALLKTLEEPIESTYLFLITSHPALLLPTIRSRCQRIHFAPVARADIEDYLYNQKDHSSEDAKLIANLSRGSIGHALNTNLEEFRAQRKHMLRVVDGLVKSEHFAALLRASEEMNSAKNRDEFESYLSNLQTLIHDVWKLANRSDSDLVNIDIRSRLERFAKNVSHRRLTSWLEEIENLREDLRYNLNRKISTDALFMKMAG